MFDNNSTSLSCDGQEDQPPTTNRGVLSTSTLIPPQSDTFNGNHLNSKTWIVDWLRIVFHYDEALLQELKSRFGEAVDRRYGGYGYTHSASVLSSGLLCWSPDRRDQGVCLDLGSSALALLDEDLHDFMIWAMFAGGKCARLDLALDDFDGLLDLDLILHQFDVERVVTRWRGYREITGSKAIKASDRIDSGKTVTVGSRKSDSFLRLYDKLAEQQAKGNPVPEGCFHWVRCELESKGARADKLYYTLVHGLLGDDGAEAANRVGEFVSEYLYGLIDFKVLECDSSDTNISRHPTADWWLRFLEVGSKSRLTLPRRTQTIETCKDWFSVSIAPMAALLLSAESAGYEWLMMVVTEAESRWGPRHKAILQEDGWHPNPGGLTDEQLAAMGIFTAGADVEEKPPDLVVKQMELLPT